HGLAADGVTRLLLRVETPGPGLAVFDMRDEYGDSTGVGTLATIDSTNFQSCVVTNAAPLNDGRYMAFAVLKAPLDFTRPPPSTDDQASSRFIRVKVQFTGQDHIQRLLTTRQLELHRPPVV